MSEVKEEAGDSRDEELPKEEEKEQIDEKELINIRIPTHTKKSQKRKHIKTDFDADDADDMVREAQRREKERLDRLEKAKPQQDHIQQIESLFLANSQNGASLPQLELSNHDFGDFSDNLDNLFGLDEDDIDQKRFKASYESEEQKPSVMLMPQQPSTSRSVVDLVDLTEDSDEDDCLITGFRSAPQPGVRRIRWTHMEKDLADSKQMEEQHSIEAERIKKSRSQKDLESTEQYGGRLLVNAGHPAEDPDVFVIPHLTQVLQPHQLGGVRFMYDNTIESISEFKKSPGFGCILAHSMGLGKTIQVITFSEIFLRATKSKKVLIIVPVNTIQNWYAEYDKWIPKLSDCGDKVRHFEVYLLGDAVKTFDQRVNLIEQWDEKGGVLLIGYDMFRTLIKTTQKKKEKKGRPKLNLSGVSSGISKAEEAQKKEDELNFETGFTNGGRVRQEAFDILRRALLDPGPDLVVCDEGHKIKNITAEISMTLGAINTKRRIVLTGYPLQNNLMEYYCMIDFVRPKYLGTRKSFVERFEKPIKNGQCVDSTKADVKIALQRTHVLVELVKGFVQRRTHHLLKKILPESKEYVLLLRKSQIQRQLYRNFVLYAKHELNNSNDSTFNPLMAFSACSKFWNHPDILYRVVEQARKTEWAAEEKKRNAEMNRAMQQQQQMMHNGMMMGYGGSPFQMQQQQQMMMHHSFFQGNWQQNGYHQLPQMPSSPFSMSSNPSTPSTSSAATPSNGKKGRKARASKKTANKSDEEEEDGEKESRMRYDWSYELFDKYQEGVLENGYKLAIALQIVDESTRIREKILIFSQNLPALDMLEEVLKKQRVVVSDGLGAYWEKNRNYLRLDGQTSGADREKLINRFNSEAGLHLFLISTRAGSLGINLVSANRCIIIDACWNPCHDAQAVCRVYRYGQQKKTYVYRMIMDNSMERSIFNRQISKHGLQQRVVDDAQVDANISQKELETLLMYEEAKDVGHDTWNTDDWQFGDDILETITKKMSHMFAEKPFLHESLIMESEKALSEEEKREAQLLFEQEKRLENDPLAGLSTSMLAPQTSYTQNFGNQWTPNPQPSFSYPRPSPMPHTLRMTLPNYHGGGHTMTSYNGFMNNNNGMGQMLPPRDPSAFMGAAKSHPPKITTSGACQNVITDRAMCFPIVGESSSNLKSVPANTAVQLVVPQSGFFVRLQTGEILKAEGSPFEQRCRELHHLYINYDFKRVTEVIDLD